MSCIGWRSRGATRRVDSPGADLALTGPCVHFFSPPVDQHFLFFSWGCSRPARTSRGGAWNHVPTPRSRWRVAGSGSGAPGRRGRSARSRVGTAGFMVMRAGAGGRVPGMSSRSARARVGTAGFMVQHAGFMVQRAGTWGRVSGKSRRSARSGVGTAGVRVQGAGVQPAPTTPAAPGAQMSRPPGSPAHWSADPTIPGTCGWHAPCAGRSHRRWCPRRPGAG